MRLAKHKRASYLALTIAIVFIALVVPTCRMVGCSMDMNSNFLHACAEHLSFNSTCGGELVGTDSPLGVVPTGIESLLMSLAVAFVAAMLLFAPQRTERAVVVERIEPPPPPLDPRGERFLI